MARTKGKLLFRRKKGTSPHTRKESGKWIDYPEGSVMAVDSEEELRGHRELWEPVESGPSAAPVPAPAPATTEPPAKDESSPDDQDAGDDKTETQDETPAAGLVAIHKGFGKYFVYKASDLDADGTPVEDAKPVNDAPLTKDEAHALASQGQ